MHGVLKPLHQLLQVRDTRLESIHSSVIGALGGDRGRRTRPGPAPAELPDPRDQSLCVAHVIASAWSLLQRRVADTVDAPQLSSAG